MNTLLNHCKKVLGPPPRKLPFERSYLQLHRPDWLMHPQNKDDRLNLIFDNLGTVLQRGIVAWGQIVQANTLMFEPGDQDCPGELLYSSSHPGSVDLNELQDVAQRLYALKGTSPKSDDLRSIADYLTAELVRVYGLEVPSSVSPDFRCGISTTFFARKHLPGGLLTQPILPILVNPKPPHVALPVPAKAWPRELIDWWLQ